MDPRVLYLDDSHWIFEGRTPDRYHIVDRWTVPGPLRDLGLLMLRLAGLLPSPDETYE